MAVVASGFQTLLYLIKEEDNNDIVNCVFQDLLARNAMLAEDLVRTGGGNTADTSQKPISGRERVQIEALRQELEGSKRQIEALKSEKAQIEAEATNQRNLAVKLESDLKSLSDAYNSLEQANYRLDHFQPYFLHFVSFPIPFPVLSLFIFFYLQQFPFEWNREGKEERIPSWRE